MWVNVRRSCCFWAVCCLFFCCLFLCGLPVGAGEGVRLDKLKLGDRDVLRLTLPRDIAPSWQEANVGRVLLRTPGRQVQWNQEQLTKSSHLDLRPDSQGCSMLQVDVGPPSSKGRSDSWRRMTRCAKIIDCAAQKDPEAELESRYGSSFLMTSKVGSRIEIRPLLSPALLRPGATLPLRLYFDGSSGKGGRVEAIGPEGQVISDLADPVGIAALEIPAPGRWTVRYQASAEGVDYLAELIFDVPTHDAWRAMEGGVR